MVAVDDPEVPAALRWEGGERDEPSLWDGAEKVDLKRFIAAESKSTSSSSSLSLSSELLLLRRIALLLLRVTRNREGKGEMNPLITLTAKRRGRRKVGRMMICLWCVGCSFRRSKTASGQWILLVSWFVLMFVAIKECEDRINRAYCGVNEDLAVVYVA